MIIENFYINHRLPQLFSLCLLGAWVLAIAPVYSQQGSITLYGSVTDESGNPLPEATVYIERGSVSTTVGADGTFRLRIPGGHRRIVCTMVGYDRQVIDLADMQEGKHRLDFVMVRDGSH